ncbi:hypothetical protein ACFXPZ_08210 [Streptomyces sp. NPDC059101]|uniref:hypothetical protein n=1 Tax=Streptomyces sp. NPDC059101 TaxID=3346728 RepID=UPI00368EAF98
MSGLVFDCAGVLLDAELGHHLRAFNQLWEELRIPWRWSEEDYWRALCVAGSKERLTLPRTDPRFRSVFEVPDDLQQWERIARLGE